MLLPYKNFFNHPEFLLILDFPKEPELPPSVTQLKHRRDHKKANQNFFLSLKRLLSKQGFITHLFSY